MNTAVRADGLPRWTASTNGKGESMRRMWLALIPLTLLTASCSLTTQTLVVDSYCDNARLMTFDAAVDSLETISEIRSHNAVFNRLCK